MRIIIDTDPGIDDSVALALAVNSPELDIAAITTTYGNTTVTRATRNAREVLARLGVGEKIPVYPGVDRPLLRPIEVAADTHGEFGLGYATYAHEAEEEGTAVEAPGEILRLVAEANENISIICLGPLTNLAVALALDRPLLQQHVDEIILMGGEPNGNGNITPVSEFNFWCDPEAARIVFQSGIPIRMVGLNVTRRMVLTRQAIELLGKETDPALHWWSDMLRFYEEFHREREGLEGCIINDPLTIALAVAPEFGVAQPMYVEIALAEDLTRGQSICDRFGFLGEPPNADVYTIAQWSDILQFINGRVFGGVIPVQEISRGAALGAMMAGT
ncbi:MAG TPA: nucleoside hydrolase [Armatimonadota bacterium]|nr:nucleoside hydrolase [Armatimonadota bacterium]